MLAVAGYRLDLLQESLDCLYPNDLVEEVTAYRHELGSDVWYDVRFSLYNMADGERFYCASARIDTDDCVFWSGVRQMPACG